MGRYYKMVYKWLKGTTGQYALMVIGLFILILLSGCKPNYWCTWEPCPENIPLYEEICARGEEFYGEKYYYNNTLDMCIEKENQTIEEEPFVDYTIGQHYEDSGWHKVNCSICGGQVWSDGCNHHICSGHICSSTLVYCNYNLTFEGASQS